MKDLLTILYVKDQEKSTTFYTNVLAIKPTLNVPGMTEFTIFDNCKIGLMPENGIAKILGNKMLHPKTGNGIPRCEIYLHVKKPKDWGDKVAYLADLDGHILAFAEKI